MGGESSTMAFGVDRDRPPMGYVRSGDAVSWQRSSGVLQGLFVHCHCFFKFDERSTSDERRNLARSRSSARSTSKNRLVC
jgi:hypothetical protein